MNRASSRLGGALVLFVVMWARTALGAAPDARAGARQVDVIIGVKANETQQLEPSIREMLAAKGLQVAITRKRAIATQDVAAAIAPPAEPTATPAVARVLLDFTVPGEATLLLIDPKRGRVYARRMALANGFDAVARASVRFVIEQSIDAILEGRDIGVSREEFQRSALPPPPVPASPPPPVAPPPPPPERRLQLAGGYEGVAMGSGEVQHAAKLVFDARFARLHAGASVPLAAPMSIAGEGVGARLSTVGGAVFGAAELFARGGFTVVAGVGAGLDMTHAEPSVTTPDAQPVASFWSGGPLVQAIAAVQQTFGRVAIAAVLAAEAHLLAERYTVKTDTATRDVFVPRRVRPAAALLVGVAF